MFRESAEARLSLTVAYLPTLLGAVLLVLVGYLLARIIVVALFNGIAVAATTCTAVYW